MRVVMLGCGGSAGVPFIGCPCSVCTSDNPRNKRTRVSLYIEVDGRHLLIDTSPDLRSQALREDITKVEAVLYTHDHADHVHGIDELRSFNYLLGKPIPIYGSTETLEVLKRRFSYAFQEKPQNQWYRPTLLPVAFGEGKVVEFDVLGVKVTAFEQSHGQGVSYGYRIGNFAYSTDTDFLSDSAFEALAGVDTWIVDCLRYQPAPTHAHLETTLRWIERLKPRQAILTHMTHEFDYDILSGELPSGVLVGYDGLQIHL